MIMLNIVIIMLLTYHFKFSGQIFSIDNYYQFSALVNKPYAHIGPWALGINVAYTYFRIVQYRKTTNEQIRE